MTTRKLAVLLTLLALAMGSLAIIAPSASADSTPPIFVGDATGTRPTSGTSLLTFTVTLGYASLNTVNVNYFTSDNTAHSNVDYQPAFGIVSFTPGTVTKTVKVTVNGSTLRTGDRSFFMNLNNPVNGVVAHNPGVGNIQDPTPNTYVNINDATVTQGDGVAGTATFTVSLTAPSANPVRVKYATSNNSARAGIEYTAESGTLTIPAASTTATINVPIAATSTFSTTRSFFVTLSNAVNAVIENNQGQGTILNDNHTAYVTVDDATVKKPASGTITMNFPVHLTTVATFDVTMNFATSDNSATTVAGDYVASAGSITIPAGTLSVNVPVTINGNVAAGNKNFFLNISGVSPGGSILRTSGVGTIVGPAAYSQFQIADVGVIAPTSGTTTMHFTITLTPASAAATSVNWTTGDNSALAGTNYTTASGTANFAAGITTQPVNVTILTSNTTFNDRSLVVNLSAATGGAVIERSQAFGMILTHDVPPEISIQPTTTPVPASGTATSTWAVTLTPASLNTVSVHFSTSDNSAIGGTDYNANSGTLTFTPGQTTKTVTATINPNTTYFGADKSFFMNLSTPANAVIQTSQAIDFLINPNKAPTLAVNNVATYKPLTGTTAAKFSVTLSSASVNTVTVHYATSNNSALAGVDYTAATGTLTFAPGIVKNTVAVTVLGGTVTTGNRNFFLTLSTPTNATISTNSGQDFIVDDTIQPYVSISSTSVVRPTSGTGTATFTVKLSSPSANTVTAHYQTGDSNAQAGLDYNAASGTVTFPPGSTSQTINVTVLARTVKTADLQFFVQLSSPTNAIMGGQSFSFASILNQNINPGLSVGDVTHNRPTSGTATETFTVTLSPASANTVTVNYATSNSSAVAGTDYTGTSGVLTFAPGVTSQPVNVTILSNGASTPNRAFFLNLSGATNAQLERSSAEGIIVDTVAPVQGISYLTVSDSSLVKPSSGSANESFTISLTPAAAVPVTVSYFTSDSSAIAGIDYTSKRGSVTFNVGQTSKTVTVAVAGNTLPSADREFTLSLNANTAPSQFMRSSGDGLIIENQLTTRVSVGGDVAVIKGDSGTQIANFVVTLNAPQLYQVQVDYATANSSATTPNDYIGDSGTLTFAPGETSKTVPITVNSNTIIEPTQSFNFNLSAPVNTVLGAASATAFIYNADVFNIVGKVVLPNGSPAAGVTLTRTGNNQPTVTATSAADGTFKIPNTLGGAYKVTPTLSGKSFLPTFTNVTVLGAASSSQNFLEYTAGAGTVIGRVAAPKPVGGVTITRTGGAQPSATATTTSLGYYAFVGLPNGTAYVFTPSLATWTFAPTNFTVNIDGVTTVASLDFVAVQATFITGRVTHAGAPVAGVTITRTGGSQPTATATTDSQGYYGFTKVASTVGGITYTLTPTLSGHTFTPTSLNATVTTTTNASGKDFVEN